MYCKPADLSSAGFPEAARRAASVSDGQTDAGSKQDVPTPGRENALS